MKWEQGRQNGAYEKLKIFSIWRFDCYILRFRPRSHVPIHRDVIEGKCHYRLNIIIKNCSFGGHFYIQKSLDDTHLRENSKRIILFRPDLMNHCQFEVCSGTKYILSFGAAL